MNDGLELFDDLSEDDEFDDDRGPRRPRRRAGGGRTGGDRAETGRAARGRPGGGRPGSSRSAGVRRPARRKKRRGLTWSIVVVLLLVIAGGAYFGVRQIMGIGIYPDYVGAGDTDLVVEVNTGDTLRDIGNTLAAADVVKSANAFIKAGKDASRIGNVQPGFYVLEKHMSGAAAVAKLGRPKSRVGVLEIKSGWQLDDTTSVTGKISKGIITRIHDASCTTLNGTSTCVSTADLQAAIKNTDPATLGVPDWAVPAVTSAAPTHRLEGLVLPGVYDLKPGENASATLKRLLAQSAVQLQAAGLPSTSQQSSGFSPYQVLVMASIVEREGGTTGDMPKISRVLYNRLAMPMNLQLDSTVDYGLDRPMVATSRADRPGAGAYDTYDNAGLPPTPISSPSTAAIQAASQPVPGPWLFFVVCQKDGTSCFANNEPDHQKNVALAHANGVF